MSDQKFDKLLESEDVWRTSIGAWFPGEKVIYRGRNLLDDLKETPWMNLLLLGITGREFDEKQIKLFEAMWVIGTSFPDPRLWNNRVAALAGTTKSLSALAISASTAVSNAQLYGFGPTIHCCHFIRRMRTQVENGESLDKLVMNYLKENRVLPGYGRPIVERDERIQPLLDVCTVLGFHDGEYVRLVFEIDEVMAKSRFPYRMNVAAFLAALTADQGLTPDQSYYYFVLCFSAGALPCYIDSVSRRPGSFFPLRCSKVKYSGPSPRKWLD